MPEEILELDQYCYLRGIELVPSISNLSHLYKVLRTKTFGHLCELDNTMTIPFSAFDKQRHHTLNVIDPESVEFEYKFWMSTDSYFVRNISISVQMKLLILEKVKVVNIARKLEKERHMLSLWKRYVGIYCLLAVFL